MVQTDGSGWTSQTTVTSTNTYETCKCCGGSGVQTKNDGIKIRCPACNGTGNWNTGYQDYRCPNQGPYYEPSGTWKPYPWGPYEVTCYGSNVDDDMEGLLNRPLI